jgi:hypothetical protein
VIGRLTSSPAVRWTALALLGVVIAIAVGVIASQVASQRIGLASEPVRAGESLAPSSTSPAGHGPDTNNSGSGSESSAPGSDDGGPGPTTTTTSTTTTVPSTTTTTTPATTGDDYGGGEGGDD